MHQRIIKALIHDLGVFKVPDDAKSITKEKISNTSPAPPLPTISHCPTPSFNFSFLISDFKV